MSRENPTWGYSGIVGTLSILGINRCEETVAEILRRQGIPPAPQRKSTMPWSEFIRSPQDVLAAADFFIADVLTSVGLVTYFVLFFIYLDTRRVHIAGITQSPHEGWMMQIARNLTMADWGFLDNVIPLPQRDHSSDEGEVECQERLGGLLKFYRRKAA